MSNDNALSTIVKLLGVTRDDVIIPHRGEPYVDNTTKMTHLRFTRRGVLGEFHAVFMVQHVAPFEAPEQQPEVEL